MIIKFWNITLLHAVINFIEFFLKNWPILLCCFALQETKIESLSGQKAVEVLQLPTQDAL